jgi:hypothetical protein
MQAIIVQWCDLIGVTSEGSIQVATGVVSGGAALFVAYAAFVIVVGTILGYIGGVIRDFSSSDDQVRQSPSDCYGRNQCLCANRGGWARLDQ